MSSRTGRNLNERELMAARELEKFNNSSIPLGANLRHSLNCFETGLNNNIFLCGASGGNKTRGHIEPILCEMVGNAMIVDPKGRLCRRYRSYLEKKGYRVRRLSFIHPLESDHYNPMDSEFVKSQRDVIKLAKYLIFAGRDESMEVKDPFWDNAAQLVLAGMMLYVWESDRYTPEEKNPVTAIRLMASLEYDDDGIKSSSPFLKDITRHRLEYRCKHGKESGAYQHFEKYKSMPPKTMNCILATAQGMLEAYDNDDIAKLVSGNDIHIKELAGEKTVIFVEISDTDRSLDTLSNIFYNQFLNELCSYADLCPGEHLPIPFRMFYDDFATNCKISDFPNIISNIRSRMISTVVVCQSVEQLSALYGAHGNTITDNCDTQIYLGGNNPHTARFFAERANRPVSELMSTEPYTAWVFQRGKKPVHVKSIRLEEYLKATGRSELERG